MKLSKRSLSVKPQPMFEIMEIASLIEKKNKKIIHLEIGDTSSFNNTIFKKILKKNITDESFRYALSGGLTKLRETIASKFSKEYSKKLSYKNIIISPCNALISEILISICDKDDAVLIPDPGFPTYGLSCDALGLKKIFYKLNEHKKWQPDLNDLEEKIKKNKKKIKAIFINSPSNPLGTVLDKKIIKKILKLSQDYNIFCIIDQTYYNLFYLKKEIKLKYSKNIFFMHTLSKSESIPGVRMGFGIGPKNIINSIENINSLFFSSQPRFIQEAVAEYLSNKSNFSFNIKNNLIKRSKKCSEIFKKANNISFIKPNGGIFMFLNIKKISPDGYNFAIQLLKKEFICVCPGNSFGPSSKSYVRINLGGNEKELYKGCEKIVKFATNF